MNTLKTILLSVDASSKYSLQALPNIEMSSALQRYLHTTSIYRTKRGAGKEEGIMKSEEIQKMVENEKRGIFRKLDVGLPKEWVPFVDRRKDTPKAIATPR